MPAGYGVSIQTEETLKWHFILLRAIDVARVPFPVFQWTHNMMYAVYCMYSTAVQFLIRIVYFYMYCSCIFLEIWLCCVWGQVLSITVSRKDDGASLEPQAHVAWYGSSTSSLMPCDQLSPFLETFKVFVSFITHKLLSKLQFLFHLYIILQCPVFKCQ
jgi:hypothetical protein